MSHRLDDVEDALGDNEACLLEPRGDYDACIIGVGYRWHSGPLAVYSIPAILDVLQADGMTREEAEEWFERNTLDAWVGDGTPMFAYPLDVA